MKKKIFMTIAVMAMVMMLLASAGCARAVATVNGFDIKRSEVDFYLDFIKGQNPELAEPGNEETFKLIESQVIDSLITNRLLEEYASKNNLVVTEEEFQAEIDKLKAIHPTEEAFLQELKDNNISLEFLNKELKVQLLRNKIFAEATKDVVATEEEMQQYYEGNKDIYFKIEEQARMGHILIRFATEEGEALAGLETEEEILSQGEALEKISDIKKQVDEGASFEDLARRYSQDPFSAENGGDMGFIGKGQLVEEFEEAAFRLKDGEISDIVETVFGYHIIKMYEYKEESYMTFEESKAEIKNYIEYLNKNEKWEEFVSSLKEQADIKTINKTETETSQ